MAYATASTSPTKGWNLRKYVTVTTIVVLLMVLGIVIAALLVGTIMGAFTTGGAEQMAMKMAQMMTDHSSTTIKQHFSVANKTAEAAQFSTMAFPSAMIPYDDVSEASDCSPTEEKPTTLLTTTRPAMSKIAEKRIRGDEGNRKWNKWRTVALNFAKNTYHELVTFSLGFLDGSYTGYSIQQGQILHSTLSNQAEPPFYANQSANLPAPRTAITNRTVYDITTGRVVSNFSSSTLYDPRLRSWFNTSLRPFETKWGTVVAHGEMPFPIINLAFSLYNKSQQIIGVGSIDLQLSSLMKSVSGQLPTENTEVILLDESRRIVASSFLNSEDVFRVVDANYTLSDEERDQNCRLEINTIYRSVLCLKSIGGLGHKPLMDMERKGLLKQRSKQVEKVELNGNPYWTSVTNLKCDYAGLDWQIVVLVPQSDVMGHVNNGIRVSVIVSFCLVVVIACVVGVLTRILLRPLIDVVWRLESAAYLKEDPSIASPKEPPHNNNNEFDSIADSDLSSSKRREKMSSKEKRLSDRSISYLSDVAAIQRAYWTMADELAVLKGYIPEHVRHQLLSYRDNVVSGSVQQQTGPNYSVGLLSRSENSNSNPAAAVAALASPHHTSQSESSGANDKKVSNDGKPKKMISIVRKTHQQKSKSSVAEQEPQTQTNNNNVAATAEITRVPSHAFSDVSVSDVEDDSHSEKLHNSRGDKDALPPDGTVGIEISPSEEGDHGAEEITLTEQNTTISHKNETSRFESLDQFSFGSDIGKIRESEPLPPFTGENTLVERHISVAVVNLVGFHSYVASTPSARVAKDHENMVSYIHEAARRCGGVLDTFSGDKFWVSFNATTDCEESPIAAALFACEVASTINREASLYHRQLEQTLAANQTTGKPPLAKPSIKFGAALRGATIGVSTGRGKVGTLGNSKVRRHAILSNAVSEAAALERMAARYPDCGVMVGGDMIPAIEGYFQYLILDATALPGSGGLRRRIASIKGLMRSKSHPPSEWMSKELAAQLASTSIPPEINPYDEINNCFNAFLEGRLTDITPQLADLASRVADAQAFHDKYQGVPSAHLPQPQFSATAAADIAIMLHFVVSAGNYMDGRLYKSPLSCMFEQQ